MFKNNFKKLKQYNKNIKKSENEAVSHKESTNLNEQEAKTTKGSKAVIKQHEQSETKESVVEENAIDELIANHNKEHKESMDLVNEKLYIELKKYIENELSKFQQYEKISMTKLLLTLFTNYGIEAIEDDLFLRTLSKLIKDMKLPNLVINSSTFKDYLKQSILNIKDTEYFEPDEEEIYRCEAFFMGRHISIKTPEFVHIISNLAEGPINIDVSQNKGENLFTIYINGTSFIMNSMDRDKVINYFEFVNNEILAEVKEKVDMIRYEINNASPELIGKIDSFLKMIPLSILLDKEHYTAFEHLISFDSFIAMQFLDSNTKQRNDIIDKLKEDADFYNKIVSFIDTSYKKLVKVAGKYIQIPEEYHSPVVWSLIKQSSIEFISEHWRQEYGVYLNEDSHIKDLNKYIEIYCRCIDIPTKNIFPIGCFTYYLMGKGLVPSEINGNFVECNIFLIEKILNKLEKIELEMFEKRLSSNQMQQSITYSINDIDLMSGKEFENFLSVLFTKMGYMTEVTSGSGDQGLDVIAEKNDVKIGIQAKCYSNKVTNKSVQEITTALSHYNCNKGMVITNNYFTDSALDLAESNNIVLWDRDILKRKIEEIFLL